MLGKPKSLEELVLKSQISLLACCVFLAACSTSAKKEAEVSLDIESEREAELAAAELDPEKQKAIWEAEHVTFELEWRFGPHFKQSLKERNQDRIVQTLRDEFVGLVDLVELETRSEPSTGILESKFVSADDRTSWDAQGFVAELLKSTESWSEIKSVGLRVLHIDRNPGDKNRWETRVLLTQDGLKDGRRVRDVSEHTVEWTIQNDEQLENQPVIDRWVVEKKSILDGDDRRLFAEVTEAALLDKFGIPDNWTGNRFEAEQYRFGVAVEDYDRDGFLDIAVAVYGGMPYLLKGSEDLKFRNVSREVGFGRGPLLNFVASWIDYDNDGFPDLLMGDRLYRNEEGRTFRDVTRETGIFIRKECMGATVADYNCDGRLDVYMLYQRDWQSPTEAASEKWVDESETGRENELWRNVGGEFRVVPKDAMAGGGRSHTHSAAWFFYDEDHLPDLYVANDFGKNVLLRNTGAGKFEDVSKASATGGFSTSMGVATGDLNNDGTNEIYVANMFSKMGRRIIANVDASDYPEGIYDQILGSCAGNQLYVRSSPSDPFVERGVDCGINQVGWAFAPAFADFNNDGLLDIYATTGFMSFQRDKPDG